jgi:hypothetical protein
MDGSDSKVWLKEQLEEWRSPTFRKVSEVS